MYFRRYTRPSADGRAAVAEPRADGAARYAIYYAPAPSSPWWQFGCEWLGRDAMTGAAVARPAIDGLSEEDIARWTAVPRRYGWHATLKAPFRLAAPYTATDLYSKAKEIAAALPCTDLGAVAVTEIDGFVAICPLAPSRAVEAVACECTRRFDYLRAPSTAEDYARRRDAGLTPRQQRIFERWGYPYAMEEFRFHMTLTDRLDAPERARVIDALRAHVAPLDELRLRIDALCIFRQEAPDMPFALMRRYGFDASVEVYHDE